MLVYIEVREGDESNYTHHWRVGKGHLTVCFGECMTSGVLKKIETLSQVQIEYL